jgi:RNA polymerase sigma factor (sigma-70 family)
MHLATDNLTEKHLEFETVVLTQEVRDHMAWQAKLYEEDSRGGLVAEELVQETTMRLWSYFVDQPIDDPLHFASFTMANLYRNYVRDDQDLDMQSQSIPEDWIEAPPMFLVTAPAQEQQIMERDVHQALATLKPADRELLHQVFWLGQTHVEIAARRKVSSQAIDQKVARLLRKLRAVLPGYEVLRHDDKTSLAKSA